MANRDTFLGQRGDISVVGNQRLGIEHNHNLIMEQSHDLGLGQTHDHDLGLVHVLAQAHDHNMVLRHAEGHGNEHESGYEQSHDDGINPVEDDDPASDQDDTDLDSHDHQLDLSAQNHEFGLLENNQLAVVENHDIDDNLELSVNQNQDLSIITASDMSVQQSHLVATPILQSRTLSPAQTHELAVGQEFPDVKSCRRALRDLAIALHFEIQTVKSDKTRFTAKCASEGCPWRVHAAKLPGVPSFTIRTIHGEHTCSGIAHLGHQQASVQWVAHSVEQSLMENPHYKPKEILEEIHRVHGITLSYKQAWRGKERLMANVRGSFEEDYRLLPQYCHQIRRTNPGSLASVYVNPVDNCFQRLFVSFQASIYGFLNACRPLIGLDRTVLKSKYLGTLLLATGLMEMVPCFLWHLGWLMRKMTITGCGFFLSCITCLKLTRKTCQGLQYCQTDRREAAYWIRRVPPRLWATAYFEGSRFGNLTANIVESLNSWILEASALPIIQMMESIRRQLMTWFNERREASMQWASILVPSAERRVSEALERARTYQLYGLPCAHAVAALLSCRQNVHRYAESVFTVATYRKAYSQTIHPIPDRTLWKEMLDGSQNDSDGSDIIINPPKSLRPPGRPRKRRARTDDRGRVSLGFWIWMELHHRKEKVQSAMD
ncbi:hypothetical protein Acr_15g0000260 [Actinidia rufa]|uniref:Zinc finger PMZ-type domain-containing protein n=1 Tax=Actinidia rufa TaxID=165716 RepID=A0A7J0FSM1_9ERIC|nr:hypothetical protein Acr_15g0000260 [Actinidia rufa]